MSVFDQAVWDQDIWGGKRDRPGAGWGDAWRVWYQVGPTVVADLTELTVEMRWTTDSYTMGDGTFRGDLSPGKGSIRFWDPKHTMETFDKMGAVWATYTPTGATWCWFYGSVERALVPAGDPNGADVVFTGDTWPLRLTSTNSYLTFPAQTINARLAAVVAAMQTHTELVLPTVTVSQDTAAQTVAATVQGPIDWGTYVYPGYLDNVRQAAANGVAWWAYGRNAAGAGTLTLRYADWEKVTDRILDNAQVVSGPPATQAIEWVINQGRFTADNGAGTKTTIVATDATGDKYGQSQIDLRLWGNIGLTTAPEYPGTNATLVNILNYRRDPTFNYVSSITMQSGDRKTAKGLPSTAKWDPTAHVFAPNESLELLRPGATSYDRYRANKSDHTLTAYSWQTTHTLERYVPAGALP